MFVLRNDKLDQKAFEIFEALDYDNSESADFFKEKCAEVPSSSLINLRDKRFGNEGRTLLHNAARKGSLSAVLILIRAGHAVEPVDSCVTKITPLMDAILNRNLEIAVVLLEAGANLFTADINGENSFHYAARGGSSRLLRSLISAGKLTRENCIRCASALTIKKQTPEDLATNAMVKEILKGLRENGYHGKLFQKSK
jgi:ankyrin repeat protein